MFQVTVPKETMMKPLHSLQQRDVADLKPGELFLKRVGSHPGLALVLDRKPTEIVCGFLRHPRIDKPSAVNLTERGACLSFGTAWALELMLTPETTMSRNYQNTLKAGDIVLGDGGTMLVFERSTAYGPELVAFDLDKDEMTTLPSEGTSGLGWRIWATAEERTWPNTQPVFEWPLPDAAEAAAMIA